MKCEFLTCEQEAIARNLCQAHLIANLTTSNCMVEGCDKPRTYKLYCTMHKTRLHKHNSFDKPQTPIKQQYCSIEGCKDRIFSKGLCCKHYSRLRRTGSTTLAKEMKLRPYRIKKNRQCEVEGCERKHLAKGLCKKHYSDQQRKSDKYTRVFREPKEPGSFASSMEFLISSM